MEHMGRPDIVFWLKPDEHFKDNEFSLKWVIFVESVNVRKYSWMAAEVVWTPSNINSITAIDADDIMVKDSLDWLFLPVDLEKKM